MAETKWQKCRRRSRGSVSLGNDGGFPPLNFAGPRFGQIRTNGKNRRASTLARTCSAFREFVRIRPGRPLAKINRSPARGCDRFRHFCHFDRTLQNTIFFRCSAVRCGEDIGKGPVAAPFWRGLRGPGRCAVHYTYLSAGIGCIRGRLFEKGPVRPAGPSAEAGSPRSRCRRGKGFPLLRPPAGAGSSDFRKPDRNSRGCRLRLSSGRPDFGRPHPGFAISAPRAESGTPWFGRLVGGWRTSLPRRPGGAPTPVAKRAGAWMVGNAVVSAARRPAKRPP